MMPRREYSLTNTKGQPMSLKHPDEYHRQLKRSGETIDIDGTQFPADVYETTNRTVYQSQQEVADEWMRGKLPVKDGNTHRLTTGTRNFKGYQHPDGSGELIHYSTTEAIRTKNQGLIDNSQCWSRGFAHCSAPSTSTYSRFRTSLPLTYIDHNLRTWRNDLDLDLRPRNIVDIIEGDESDPQGYNKLVVYEDGHVHRAANEKFEAEPLLHGDIPKYLKEIQA